MRHGLLRSYNYTSSPGKNSVRIASAMSKVIFLHGVASTACFAWQQSFQKELTLISLPSNDIKPEYMYANNVIADEHPCSFLEELDKNEEAIITKEEQEIHTQMPHHRHFVSIFPGAAFAVLGLCVGGMGVSLLARAVTEAVKLIFTGIAIFIIGISSIGIGYATDGFGTASASAMESLQINHKRALRLKEKVRAITSQLSLGGICPAEQKQLKHVKASFKERLRTYYGRQNNTQTTPNLPQNTSTVQAPQPTQPAVTPPVNQDEKSEHTEG